MFPVLRYQSHPKQMKHLRQINSKSFWRKYNCSASYRNPLNISQRSFCAMAKMTMDSTITHENNSLTNNTNNNSQIANNVRSLTIDEIVQMVEDPEIYDAEALKPYFRRYPREGISMILHLTQPQKKKNTKVLIFVFFVRNLWIFLTLFR